MDALRYCLVDKLGLFKVLRKKNNIVLKTGLAYYDIFLFNRARKILRECSIFSQKMLLPLLLKVSYICNLKQLLSMSKVLAIKYIIYRVAQEFNKYHGQAADNVAFFNEKNNFSLSKCLVLPYIITIANGNKNFFLDGIFKNAFLPQWENNDRRVVVGEIQDGAFKIYSAEDLGLQFSQAGNLMFDFNQSFQQCCKRKFLLYRV